MLSSSGRFKRLRIVLGCGLLALSALFPTTPVASQDFSKLFKSVSSAVVLVDTEVTVGSGFIIDDVGIVVTACHLVDTGLARFDFAQHPQRIARIFLLNDPRTYIAILANGCHALELKTNTPRMLDAIFDDVALLRILGFENEAGEFFPLMAPTGLQRLWLSDAEPDLLEAVFLAAYGGPFSEFSITAGSLAGTLSLFSLVTEHHFSGLDFIWDLRVLEKQTPDVALEVFDLVEGGPAQRAGIGIGDLILDIDGAPLTSNTVDERVTKLHSGQTVSLRVRQPDGTEFIAELTLGDFVLRERLTLDRIWCFEQEKQTLTSDDFNRATHLDLKFSRTTLERVLDLVRECPMALVADLTTSNGNRRFRWIGVVTGIEGDKLLLEKISNSALTPFSGQVVRRQNFSHMGVRHFLKITSIADFGSSGGPVLNTAGQVLGLMNFGFSDPVPAYIVKAQVIRRHLEALIK